MKPKAQTEHDTGMLEFLEDIIGTSRFKVPIEQLSKRVEEYNEMRVEKLNRVKLVEKEKDDLEPAMMAALGYIRMENEKTEKLYRQRRKYIQEAEGNIAFASLSMALFTTPASRNPANGVHAGPRSGKDGSERGMGDDDHGKRQRRGRRKDTER